MEKHTERHGAGRWVDEMFNGSVDGNSTACTPSLPKEQTTAVTQKASETVAACLLDEGMAGVPSSTPASLHLALFLRRLAFLSALALYTRTHAPTETRLP